MQRLLLQRQLMGHGSRQGSVSLWNRAVCTSCYQMSNWYRTLKYMMKVQAPYLIGYQSVTVLIHRLVRPVSIKECRAKCRVSWIVRAAYWRRLTWLRKAAEWRILRLSCLLQDELWPWQILVSPLCPATCKVLTGKHVDEDGCDKVTSEILIFWAGIGRCSTQRHWEMYDKVQLLPCVHPEWGCALSISQP